MIIRAWQQLFDIAFGINNMDIDIKIEENDRVRRQIERNERNFVVQLMNRDKTAGFCVCKPRLLCVDFETFWLEIE